MIKFFRHVRKSLIEKNQMGKYVKYAIGEILLVVIGILIALQINEWNQAKKDRKLEAQYYCRLLEDVEQDYVNYKSSLDLLSEKIKTNNTLMQKLLDDTMPLDSISPYLLESIKYSIRDVSATTDAFEDIKSSGNLNIIRNASVKNKLTSYYEVLANTNSILEGNGRAITDVRFFKQKDLISSGWIKLLEDFNEIDTSKVSMKALKSKVNFTDEIRKSMTNDAVFYMGINSRNKQLLKLLESEIQSMIKLLDSKCKNSDD